MRRARALGAILVLLGALTWTFAGEAAALGAPIVSDESASPLSATSEELSADINPNGHLTTWHVDWGPASDYGNSTPAQSLAKGAVAAPVNVPVSGLQPNTTYHYRFVATNSSGPVDGGDATFTTSGAGQAPSVSTGGASAVSASDASVSGGVNPNGADTTYHFDYGTTTAYGRSTGSHDAGAGTTTVGVLASLTGLQPGTIYHYRLVAANAAGTTTGGDGSFSTAAVITRPAASTGAATGVSATSAVLTAVVDPGGMTTTVTFEYGPTPSYGNTTSARGIGAGTSDVPVNATITGLTPNTTYHYRVVASNAAGVLTGADVAVTTADTTSTSATATPSTSGAPTSGFVNVTGKNSTSAAAVPTGPGGAPSPTSTLINANANSTSHSALSGGSLGIFLTIAAVILLAIAVLSGYFVVTTGRNQENEA